MATTCTTVTHAALPDLLDRWIAHAEVFAPVSRDGVCRFERLARGKDARLDSWLTKIPLKEMFLPSGECLYTYSRAADGNLVVEAADAPENSRIVFGVRPCDARSLALLDKVFLTGATADPNFRARRENTVLVGIACTEPRSTCFCTAVGASPFEERYLDALLLETADGFIVRMVTEKGKALFQDMPEAPAPAPERFAEAKTRAEAAMPGPLPLDVIRENLDTSAHHPFWDRIHEPCFGCGVCAFVCPACHCFDLTHLAGAGESSGRCIRSWDACMFPLFTQQASGENPRPTNKERMRQRMMHKFNYFVKTHGLAGCVGCGRCITECPASIDIRDAVAHIGSLSENNVVAQMGADS